MATIPTTQSMTWVKKTATREADEDDENNLRRDMNA